MSFQPDKSDPEDIIEHLTTILSQLKYSTITCDLCNWIDYEDSFVKCCKNSNRWCCTHCVGEAKESKLKLCGKECEEEIISDSEEET